ncbi:hypothetical protein PPYR_15537, partial [Photinus pyralis]
NMPGQKLVVADNLASHFTPVVVSMCKENDIYFTTIPPNATHLMQPLDVAFFKPLKSYWRNVLESWRKESRCKGSIPKQQFPSLLSRLYAKLLTNNGEENARAGFRKTGLVPYDPDQVIKLISSDDRASDTGSIGRTLDSSIIDFLKEQRDQAGARITRK